MSTLENISKRIAKQVKGGDKEAVIQDSVIKKCMPYLEQGKFIDSSDFTADEKRALHMCHLLMSKPVIYCANVSEMDLKEGNDYTKRVQEYAGSDAQVVLICANLEEELVDLGEEEAKNYLAELGIENSGIERMIKSAYDILNLRTYITAGEKEVRAWTITKGMKAPQAAGVIHTDFEKGFIRAEVISPSDFITLGGEVAVKEAGKMRLVGRDYIMNNGDICHFLFNN